MSLFTSIHKMASSIIPTGKIRFRKFINNSPNDFGIVSQNFSEWQGVAAHIQPGIVSSFGGKGIELKDYKELGLDWSRRHITVWLTDKGLEPCCNKDGADQIKYHDKVFTILQVENWDEFNNWQRCYCVEEKGKQ